MSDFDKEAEREKLRKKFADDDEKRADTRRMSELLLKGATMTNKHCGQCSDPLFRYDGQTFCPSCQAQDPPAQSESAPQTDTVERETQTEPAPDTQQPDPQATQPSKPRESETPTDRTGQADPSTDPQSEPQTAYSTQPRATRSQETASPVSSRGEKTNSAGDLTAARQSLTRTVTRFAQEAERTDDPRRARELLTAAREAAATLSELE